jgi:hypothetical protein
MKERPILFSGPMVNAILECRKTQTRRIVKPQPSPADILAGDIIYCGPMGVIQWCPYAREVNNRLWVRETFYECVDNNDKIHYAADGEPPTTERRHYKKRPSIFMPRLASRITLEITGVRVERLQDISDSDCIAEGISDEAMDECEHYQIAGSPLRGGSVERCAYSTLWESINGPGSWEKNPFVWVIEFKRI